MGAQKAPTKRVTRLLLDLVVPSKFFELIGVNTVALQDPSETKGCLTKRNQHLLLRFGMANHEERMT